MGRPSTYDPEVALGICEELSATDRSLASICQADNMPEVRTVYRWLEADEAFRQQYARAKSLQADVLAAQVVDISNTPEEGVKTKTDKDGNLLVETGDMVEHRRLKIDARKWYASKLAPKKYGDRLALDAEVVVQQLTAAETIRRKRQERLKEKESK